MDCPYVEKFWGLIRDATEAGTLGISAKISTDWGMHQDPAGSWRKHVVCVHTADWRRRDDVLRVARRLHAIGAVNKMTLLYKPDLFTRGGMYEGNSEGEVTIYKCSPPYVGLTPDAEQLALAESMLSREPNFITDLPEARFDAGASRATNKRRTASPSKARRTRRR
jgi:hypothetical protein